MKAIVVSFSLKGQSFEDISARLRELASSNHDVILIHGFLPRAEVVKRKIPTDVVDLLDELWPMQLNLNNGDNVLRQQMADVAAALGANVFVVGEVIEGVKEEVDAFISRNLNVSQVSLDGKDAKVLNLAKEASDKGTGEGIDAALLPAAIDYREGEYWKKAVVVEFGNFLLSEDREKRVSANWPDKPENVRQVSHADLANFTDGKELEIITVYNVNTEPGKLPEAESGFASNKDALTAAPVVDTAEADALKVQEARVRALRVNGQVILNTVANKLGKSRETSIVVTALENGRMWLGKVLEAIGVSNPYVSSGPSVQPAADHSDDVLGMDSSLTEIEVLKHIRANIDHIHGQLPELYAAVRGFEANVAVQNAYTYFANAKMWLGQEMKRVSNAGK